MPGVKDLFAMKQIYKTLGLDGDTYALITEVAKETGRPRTKVVKSLVQAGYEQYQQEKKKNKSRK